MLSDSCGVESKYFLKAAKNRSGQPSQWRRVVVLERKIF